MAAHDGPTDPTRILCIVLSRRCSGIAVLDRWGVAGHGLRSSDLRHLEAAHGSVSAAVRQTIRLALREYRPALVVLARSPGEHLPPVIPAVARRVLSEAGIPTVSRRVTDGRRLFLDRAQGPRHQELAHRLCEAFFPELHDLVLHRDYENERYYRHAWHALALALQELVERHPRQAFALARSDVGNFGRTVAASERRHNPTL